MVYSEIPEITVLMTVYNEEKYVKEAIISILNQSFTNFEFLIINDGSIDQSLNIITKFSDKRIKIINQENIGLAKSLNYGITLSKGKFIARQDADDISHPERLEKQIQLFHQNDELGLVGTNSIIMTEEKMECHRTKFPTSNKQLKKILRSKNFENPFIHGSVVFRKNIALNVGMYREYFKQSQDLDLWLRMSEISDVENLPDYLYSWRLRNNSITLLKSENQRDYAKLAKQAAYNRRRGLNEPIILEDVQRKKIRKFLSFFRRNKPDSEYYLSLGNFFLANGKKHEAKSNFKIVLQKNPLNFYGWLLFLLTFLPGRSTFYFMNKFRKIYRLLIWK